MPDLIDENGLQVKTFTEIKDALDAGFRAIYGNDINIDQNSPDGQIIGILSQMGVDLRELLVQINSGFDPDQAVGVVLDQRVAINNITRQGGTFTLQPIDLVIDRTVTLDGLDAAANDINGGGFTVADDAGNEWILVDSETFIAGAYTRNFRAKNIGAVESVIGTITNFVTIVLGVVSVNNSSGVLQSGSDQETDSQLRIRRQKSVAINSSGYLDGIEGEMLALDGVTDVKVYENVTNAIDADGIPAHGMWAIVENGANSDIGNVIYTSKSYGANMKGDVSVDISRPNGDIFTAKFDRPVAEDLYIRFDIQKTAVSPVFDQGEIKNYMVANLSYKIGESAETATLTALSVAAINATGGGGVPVNVEVSGDGIAWLDFINVTAKLNQFVVDTTRITITELP